MKQNTLVNFKHRLRSLSFLLMFILSISSLSTLHAEVDKNTIQTNPNTGTIISLKANNGKFISSENGNIPMKANRSSAGEWEKFVLIYLSNGKVAIKGSNGKFVSSENGKKPITCNRHRIGLWEKFQIVDLGNNHVAFKGNNGLYISSEDGKKPMMCNRPKIGPWERFNINRNHLQFYINPGKISETQVNCGPFQPNRIIGTIAKSSDGASIIYQWQVKKSMNANWENITNANAKDYTPEYATIGSRWYRRAVKRKGTNSYKYSNVIDIHAKRPPNPTVEVTNANCILNTGEIIFKFNDVPERTHIKFSIDNGLNFISVKDNSKSYTFSDLSVGNYQLITMWGNGDCKTTLDAIKIEKQCTPLKPGIITRTQVNCGAFQPEILTGTEVTTNDTSSVIYQWQIKSDTGGQWKNIIGAIEKDYLPPFTEIGSKWYRRAVKRKGTDNYVFSNVVDIHTYRAPNPTVVITDVDCLSLKGAITFTFENIPERTHIQFSIDGGQNFISVGDWTKSYSFENLEPGTYKLSTKWGNGDCETELETVVLEGEKAEVIVSEDQSICKGDSITLTATGNGELLWSTAETTNSIEVNPTIDTTYNVTLINKFGCEVVESIAITVNDAEVTVDNKTICLGETTTLTAIGEGSFLWSTGETTSSINVNPEETTSYQVTLTNNNGCKATTEATVNVNNATVSVGDDLSICDGESVTLTATGNGDFLWSTGETTTTINVTPEETTVYSVTASEFDCTASDEITVTVKKPDFTFDPPHYDICLGESVTITAPLADSYLWKSGETTRSITVSPTDTVTWYQVTGTIDGCEVMAMTDVFVNDTRIDAGDNQIICEGETVTLTAVGTDDIAKYLWSTGEKTKSIEVSPTETTTYTVTVNSRTCTKSDDVTVTINKPDFNFDPPHYDICLGESVTITAPLADSYLWKSGETTRSITVSPTDTVTWYQVTGTIDGCEVMAMTDVFVNDTRIDAGDDQIICEGETVTLTAVGTDDIAKYLWSTGEKTKSIEVSPTETTTYTVTVNSRTCAKSDDVTVTINKPDFTFDPPHYDICLGESVTVTAPLADSYLWKSGETTRSITVSPTDTVTWYQVTGTIDGCEVMAMTDVFVNDTRIDAGDDQIICEGETVTLTAVGTDDIAKYLWSTGEKTKSIEVSPTETTTYTVTVNSRTCTKSDDVTVTINKPDFTFDPPHYDICLGESVTITAPLADSYLWKSGETTRSITVSPTDTVTWYQVTGTIDGCEVMAMTDVFVNDTKIDAGDDQIIEQGETVTLTAVGTDDIAKYLWSTGEKTKSIEVSPNETTTYTITVNSRTCTKSDDVTVEVEIDPCLANQYLIDVVPNPVASQGTLNVSLAVDQSQDITYTFYRIDGSRIGPESTISLDEGCNYFDINLGRHCTFLPESMYILKVIGNGWSKNEQIITQ